MIRIRTTDKQLIELPDNAVFVEIVDTDNDIICVINKNKKDRTCEIFDSKDKEKAKRYSKFFGVKFVNNIVNL